MENMYTQQQLTDAFRSAIEDRATWFYLLLKAAKEEGGDVDRISSKAIFEFGRMKGLRLAPVNSPGEFIKKLSCGHVNNAFEMKEQENTEDRAVLRFGYCALVEAWKKLGLNGDEIAELCRLARYGDLGVVSNFPNLKLDFGKLLSEGEEYCELIVTRVSK